MTLSPTLIRRCVMLDRTRGNGERPPLVGVVCDRRTDDGVELDTIRTRYIEALRMTGGVVPVGIPSGLSGEEAGALLARLDGVLLTGAASDIAPERYGGSAGGLLTDLRRDATVFALVRAAVERGVPLFGICRGLQEMNVAFGGDLVPDLRWRTSGEIHHEDVRLPRDRQYAPAHRIELTDGGVLAGLLGDLPGGGEPDIRVNSLHHQAIGRPAPGVRIEAVTRDGVIEAISIDGAASFALAVQWHPEWFHATDPIGTRLFRAFGDACHARSRERTPAE